MDTTTELIEQPQQAMQITPPTNTTPAQLLAIAVQRGADIAQLERLMALQERFEANEARKAYHDAVSAFRAEPIEIFKRKGVGYETNDGNFVGYKHAELSDVTDAIAPMLAKHGLSYRWDERVEGKTVHCTCIVSHRLGHEERGQPLPGPFDDSGKKNQIQQLGSTLTYLRRYTLLGVLGLSTKGEDNDGAGGDGDDAPTVKEDLIDPDLLRGLHATTTDEAARDFWIANRGKTGDTKSAAYNAFKNAAAEHRRKLGGAQ